MIIIKPMILHFDKSINKYNFNNTLLQLHTITLEENLLEILFYLSAILYSIIIFHPTFLNISNTLSFSEMKKLSEKERGNRRLYTSENKNSTLHSATLSTPHTEVQVALIAMA